MDVPAVRGKNRLVAQKPSQDRERNIQQRNRYSQQRHGHADQGRGFLRPHRAIASQKKADKHGSGISQENRGGVEVVAQKRNQRSHQRNAGVSERHILLRAAPRSTIVSDATSPMPAARPSRPSTRLNAFVQASSQNKVSGRLNQMWFGKNPATPATRTPAQ